MKRLSIIILSVLASILLIATPVLAIGNPTNISFGTGSINTPTYHVFYNATAGTTGVATGDWLIEAEGFVYYTPTPPDYPITPPFLFELMNTSGNVTLISTPLVAYGDRPIGMYLTASQVSSIGGGLTPGTAYVLRIVGNPLVFPSSVGNIITTTLVPHDYADQSLATSDVNLNPIYLFNKGIATNIQAHDLAVGILAAGSTYLTTVQGNQMLNTTGGNIFLAGVPSLDIMCPSLFQSSVQPVTAPDVVSTGAYPTASVGTTLTNGFHSLGTFLGVGQDNGGGVVLLVIGIFLAIFLFKRTESGIAVLAIVAALPFVGGFLGMINLAIGLTVGFIIVIIMLYYFFSRGIL